VRWTVEEHDFLAAFHRGDRAVIEQVYRDYGARVIGAAQRLVGPVDAETIAHDVFYKLLTNERTRASFRGGNLGAWLTQVAVRAAVDDLRKRRRETAHERDAEEAVQQQDTELEAKILIERFQKEILPAEWAALFDVRFLRQLPQRDAAKELGIPRSTLVYQEQKIRDLLERFLLGGGDS